MSNQIRDLNFLLGNASRAVRVQYSWPRVVYHSKISTPCHGPVMKLTGCYSILGTDTYAKSRLVAMYAPVGIHICMHIIAIIAQSIARYFHALYNNVA